MADGFTPGLEWLYILLLHLKLPYSLTSLFLTFQINNLTIEINSLIQLLTSNTHKTWEHNSYVAMIFYYGVKGDIEGVWKHSSEHTINKPAFGLWMQHIKRGPTAWFSQPLALSHVYLLMWQLLEQIHPAHPDSSRVRVQAVLWSLHELHMLQQIKQTRWQTKSQTKSWTGPRSEPWWPDCATAKQSVFRKKYTWLWGKTPRCLVTEEEGSCLHMDHN